jgi:hypothetical protein
MVGRLSRRDRNLVRLRPRADTLYISRNHTVLVTGTDGVLRASGKMGLFVDETRLLSECEYRLNGEPLKPVAVSAVEQHSSLGYYIADTQAVENSGEKPSAKSLELCIARAVAQGVHEDLDLVNYTQVTQAVSLEVYLAADFADYEEAGSERKQSGDLRTFWNDQSGGAELAFDYEVQQSYSNQEGSGVARLNRGLRIRPLRSGSPATYQPGRICFRAELKPLEAWHCCLLFIPVLDGQLLPAPLPCYSLHRSPLHREAGFNPDGGLKNTVLATLDRAEHDLIAMGFEDVSLGPGRALCAGGLPVYVARFGRDALTTGWEYAMVNLKPLRGILIEGAHLQGREENDWRDEQRGRIFHEAHNSPLAMLNVNPRQRYYGSITSSAFYPAALAELWHWTGDTAEIHPFVDPAIRALQWLDKYGDLDGDGLYEYRTLSTQGIKNQGWKDSGDAIVYGDGSQVPDPIALLEVHGFAFASKVSMAEILFWLGRSDEALLIYRQAMELKKRFNERFWMADEQAFAMGLDPDKRQIKSISSSVGLCIATGIVDEELIPISAERLMSSEFFSGWGIRTLSCRHPAYNPYSYHRGSVWPVEQGTIALGFMRYGLIHHMHRLARSQFELAEIFDHRRLPELISGHQRSAEHPFPALYPEANWPQAWSASSVFTLIQSLLGIVPYAPLETLFIDPHLPEWLPELTMHSLRVGRASVTIKFMRGKNDRTEYRILKKEGRLRIIRQPSPWSFSATFPERVRDLVSSFFPAH